MQDLLLSAIETFYDCVDKEFNHQRAIESLSRAADDTGFVFSKTWPLLGGQPPIGFHNIPEETINVLINGGFEIESHEMFKNLILMPELIPVLRRTYLSDKEHFKTRLYLEAAKPWGLHSEGVSILNKLPEGGLACWFVRHPNQPEIDYDLLCRIAVLNKHLAHAMGLQDRVDRLSEAVIHSDEALDLVDFGLALYGKDEAPIYLNKLARRICAAEDGIRLSKNSISIQDRDARIKLDVLLTKIKNRKTPLNTRAGGVVRVLRPSGKQAYSMMVIPLSTYKKSGMENITIAVLIFDPSLNKNSAIKLFTSSYGLTQAESRLALELAKGISMDDFATKRQISITTARTQLRSIFAKTETSRQPELISLLLKSVASMNLE